MEIREEFKAVSETIYFDIHDNLREKTSDPATVRKFVEKVAYLLETEKEDLYFLYGLLGNLHRIMEQPKIAIDYLKRAIDLAKEAKDNSKIAITLIRLGEAYKYNNERQQALNTFDQAIEILQEYNLENLLDFAYQHKGKCLLELEQYEEAEKYFRETLELRKQKKDPSLMQSTKKALDYLEANNLLQ